MPDIERAEASDLNALPCFQRINHAVKESAAIRSNVTFIEWMGDLSALCRDDRDGGVGLAGGEFACGGGRVCARRGGAGAVSGRTGGRLRVTVNE